MGKVLAALGLCGSVSEALGKYVSIKIANLGLDKSFGSHPGYPQAHYI